MVLFVILKCNLNLSFFFSKSISTLSIGTFLIVQMLIKKFRTSVLTALKISKSKSKFLTDTLENSSQKILHILLFQNNFSISFFKEKNFNFLAAGRMRPLRMQFFVLRAPLLLIHNTQIKFKFFVFLRLGIVESSSLVDSRTKDLCLPAQKQKRSLDDSCKMASSFSFKRKRSWSRDNLISIIQKESKHSVWFSQPKEYAQSIQFLWNKSECLGKPQKKVPPLILMARPLRPYPPPPFELNGNKNFFFFFFFFKNAKNGFCQFFFSPPFFV